MASFVYHWGKRYLMAMGSTAYQKGSNTFGLADDSNDAIRAILVKAGSPCLTQYHAKFIVNADNTWDVAGSGDQVTGIATSEANLLPVQDASDDTIHATVLDNAPSASGNLVDTHPSIAQITCDPIAFTGISESAGSSLGGVLLYLAVDSSTNWAHGDHGSDATDLTKSIPLAFYECTGTLDGVSSYTITFSGGAFIYVA